MTYCRYRLLFKTVAKMITRSCINRQPLKTILSTRKVEKVQKQNHENDVVSKDKVKGETLAKIDVDQEMSDCSTDVDSEDELDYEELRKQNIRDNEAFFNALGIKKAKEELKLLNKMTAKSMKKVKKTVEREPLAPRRSLRIQHIDPTGVPRNPEPEPEPQPLEHPQLPSGPLPMVEISESTEDHHKRFIQKVQGICIKSCQYKPHSSDLSRFVSAIKRMQITVKAKVCKDRLFSVAVHPTHDKVLALAGDKWGRLGLWNVSAGDPDSSVVTYKPHSRPIGHIAVHPASPLCTYTCSYDSTLRCCHFEKQVFDEVYSVPEEDDDLFRNFDFVTPYTLLLAQYRGDVALVDIRTPRAKAQHIYRVCDKYLRTVSVHPTDSRFFCTAGTDLTVAVWDLRKMRAKGNKPLHALAHGKAVSSAYFSPLTGSRILTCSTDDTIRLFTCSSSCGDVSLAKQIRHNNQTGRWLTPFRAVWHPAREDIFFVGSMKSPRRIEAFDLDGHLLHEFGGDVLSSVCSVVQFHPSRNVLVGGNSSGYIFHFM